MTHPVPLVGGEPPVVRSVSVVTRGPCVTMCRVSVSVEQGTMVTSASSSVIMVSMVWAAHITVTVILVTVWAVIT